MSNRLKLTREQLSSFLGNDHAKIKQFEKLFVVVDDIQGTIATDPGAVGDSAGVEALAELERVRQALELLPVYHETQEPEDLGKGPVPREDPAIFVDYVDLAEYGPHETRERRMQWNPDDGTIDVGLYNGVVWQGGQELHFYVKNTSGAVIQNGSSVMATGTIGASGKITVAKAIADGSIESDFMIGVSTQDIEDNTFGYVTCYGKVRGIDTTGAPYGEVWADGDVLYFNPTVPGGLTNVMPTAPALKSKIAFVVYAHANVGELYVRMKVGQKITSLEDVTITLPLTGQKLRYNGSLWVNAYEPVTTTAISYNVLLTDSIIKATGTGITITLPTAVGYTGKEYTINNAGNGLVTVIGAINGQSNMILRPGSTMQIYSDGAGYQIK